MSRQPEGVGATKARLTVVKVGRILSYLAWFWVIATLVILLLGFVLLLLGASPEAEFTQWVYRAVHRAMRPFRGIFDTIELGSESVFDVSILFAMIVYGIAGFAIRALLDWLTLRMVRLDDELDRARAAARRAEAPAPTPAGPWDAPAPSPVSSWESPAPTPAGSPSPASPQAAAPTRQAPPAQPPGVGVQAPGWGGAPNMPVTGAEAPGWGSGHPPASGPQPGAPGSWSPPDPGSGR